jgi:hypothetical protein
MLFLNNLAGIIDPRLKNRAPTSVALSGTGRATCAKLSRVQLSSY